MPKALPFMNHTFRLALLASVSLSLVAGGADAAVRLPHFGKDKAAAPAAAAPAQADAGRSVWPQAASDVAADPAIRFGVLANGMRYAIMKNATPTGQASMRLRFDAGSLMERDEQQGLAHFLEHMAFKGSAHVPADEMVKILERHGLAFGADTNASTSWDETIYKLDLPKADDETVDTTLMLLREAADQLTLSQDAMNGERGVVLSEERARDTPPLRVFMARMDFFLKGQLAPRRMPIGKVDVLKNAPVSLIRDFYSRYYRPDRAVLIAVGDFDVDALEAKIKAKFGDWKPAGPAGPEPDLGVVAKRGTEAKVFVEPGAPTSVQVAWIAPPDLTPDSQAKRRRDLVESLGMAVLNRRLERIARSGEPPFIGAGAFRSNLFHSARVTALAVSAQNDRWKEALTAAEQEQRRVVEFGVRQDELDREIDELRAKLKAAADGQATRRTPALANEIVGTLADREVQTNPAQDLALFEQQVKGLTAAEVSKALKGAFQGQGPLVFMAAPTAIDGGDKALADVFAAAQNAKLTAGEAQVAKTWPYETFGVPGKVVERKEVSDLDAVFVRFANGVRLTVKPTKFREQQILVTARIGDGRLGMPKDRVTAAWAAGSAFPEGGLDQLSAEELDAVLRSKIVGARFALEDDAVAMSGGTRPDDLQTELQLLAAYAVHPGWRPEAFQRTRTYGETLHDQQDATAAGVMGRELPALIRSGDKRWAFPSRQEITASKPEDLKALLQPQLAGPIEVLVVGDTTVEKAIDAVASTFGALPARPDAAPPAAGATVAFPAASAAPSVLTHKGRADQTMGFMAWPTEDFFSDMQRARTLRILGDVLQLRLTDALRIKLGATYSPSVSASSSSIYPRYGFIAASMETPPATLDAFFTETARIAADLRAKPVTDDELKRAKAPAIDSVEKRMQTNEYWLNGLAGAQTDGRRLDALRSAVPALERVSAADVQKAAQTYLRDDKAWKLEVKPAAGQ